MVSTVNNNSNSLFVIGRNAFGQFGLGHKKEISILTEIKQPYVSNVTNIYCGYNFIIYIDKKNNYFGAGCNYRGSLGINNFKYSIQSFKQITYFKNNNIKIKKVFISTNSSSTFWLSIDNKLYGNGHNFSYNLGIGHKNNLCLPVHIQLYKVIDIALASKYSLALCDCGFDDIINNILRPLNTINFINNLINLIKKFYGNTIIVYSTPYSYYGGNGHGNSHIVLSGGNYKWHPIEALKDIHIIKICAGFEHSLFLSSSGVLWSCGSNQKGQLGHGIEYSAPGGCKSPAKIRYFVIRNIKIKDISCGWYHNLAIDYNNIIYSWGSNEHGECLGFTFGAIYQIEKFMSHRIINIGCGKNHSYAVTTDGLLYVFGDNKYNQCIVDSDYGNIKPINNILSIDCSGKRIQKVVCGLNETIFITK